MKQILLFLSFFQTFIAAADITGKVLINEVMADPVNVAGLPETEYIELWNNSGTPVSLEGWTLFYDKKAVGLSAFSLPEDGYIVLYRADRDIMVAESGHTMPLESFPAQLANTGKALRLVDNQGNEVDNIAYPKAKRGFSWERVNDGWMVCEDPLGGTPGAVNSISGDDYPEPEAIISCILNGFTVREVPVKMEERQGGVSSIRSLKSAYYMIKVCLSLIVHRIQASGKAVK